MAFLYENDNHIELPLNYDTVDDEDIVQFIDSNDGEDYSEILKKDNRWNVFYHLSVLRESLFNWYDFQKSARLLEIGAGFGALTGLFAEKCMHVTVCEESGRRARALTKRYQNRANIDVYEGKWEAVKEKLCGKTYDYIVLTDLGSTIYGYANLTDLYLYLAELKKYLTENGRILLTAANSLGVRYLCGAPDDYTNVPYDSLNKYPNGSRGRTFTRQELITLCDMCGLYFKFYYPLPDAKVAQMICTDDAMPVASVRDRVIPYYVYNNSLIALEKNLYDDFIQSHNLNIFANSFLLECSETGSFCDVRMAALSTDRGKQHGFATTIRWDGTVHKAALGENGVKELQKMYDNIRELQKRGISVVPHEMIGKELVMPCVDSCSVMAHIQQLVRKSDATEAESVIDDMWGLIMRSSDSAGQVSEQIAACAAEETDWGPILESAYIDMIPLNSFWIDGEICYYDQEFKLEKCPAKYVLFRVLNYTYAFVNGLEEILPLEFLKKKYGLCGLWEIFEQMERKFVSENRDYQLYHQFYKWAEVDPETVYYRAAME